MRNFRSIIAAAAICVAAFSATAASASPYLLTLTGQVVQQGWPYAPTGSSVTVGITYDSAPTPYNTITGFGGQYAQYKNAVTSISISMAAIGFSGTYSNAAGFGDPYVSNNYGGQDTFGMYFADYPGAGCCALSGNYINLPEVPANLVNSFYNTHGDYIIDSLRFGFVNSPGTAFSSTALPTFLDPNLFSVTDFEFTMTADSHVSGYAAVLDLSNVTWTLAPVQVGSSVPEPASVALLLSALAALLIVRRKRRA